MHEELINILPLPQATVTAAAVNHASLGSLGALVYTQFFHTPTDSTHLRIMGRNLLLIVLERTSGKCKY